VQSLFEKRRRESRGRDQNTGRLGFRLVLIGQFYEYIFEGWEPAGRISPTLIPFLEELRTEIV